MSQNQATSDLIEVTPFFAPFREIVYTACFYTTFTLPLYQTTPRTSDVTQNVISFCHLPSSKPTIIAQAKKLAIFISLETATMPQIREGEEVLKHTENETPSEAIINADKPEPCEDENGNVALRQPQRVQYTVFTQKQKSWIIFIAALAGWFSTASSFVYFPAIPFIAADMGISIEQVNLTVTLYLIASAIFPAITGNIADRYGRRIAFIFSLGAYVFVNIGLALQRNLAALFVLRMLQSASISGAHYLYILNRY